MFVSVTKREQGRLTFKTSLRSGIPERSPTPPAELPLRPLTVFEMGFADGAVGGISITGSEASRWRLGLCWDLNPPGSGPAWVSWCASSAGVAERDLPKAGGTKLGGEGRRGYPDEIRASREWAGL